MALAIFVSEQMTRTFACLLACFVAPAPLCATHCWFLDFCCQVLSNCGSTSHGTYNFAFSAEVPSARVCIMS